MSYPAEKYPRVLWGFSLGRWRWEKHLDDRREDTPDEEFQPGGFLFNKDRSSENWGTPTQQYESWLGFTLLKPYALNVWVQPRKQKIINGHRVPGTEWCKYIRFALWRWDPWGTVNKMTGIREHWIKNSVYFNLSTHWD